MENVGNFCSSFGLETKTFAQTHLTLKCAEVMQTYFSGIWSIALIYTFFLASHLPIT